MGEILENFETLLENPVENPEEEIEVQPPVEETPAGDPNPDENPDPNPDETPDYSGNPVYLFLQEKGIKDPGKIQVTNEDDTTEELDFSALSIEDQLQVLRDITDPGLTDSEIDTINYLRKNNATLEQVVDYFAEKRLQEYLQQHPEDVHQKTYGVDSLSDDDLFVTDLRNRYPDLTDEEVNQELETAKANEDLFKKKAEILRNTYKQNEDQAEAEKAQLAEQEVEDFKNNLMEAASRFNEIQLDYTDDKSDSLVIDEEDKQQMMSYILDQDADGKSQLVKDLQDFDRLIEIAWFGTQGPKMLSELTQYWKGLLTKEREENRQLQSKLDKLSKSNSFVVTPSEKKTKTEGSI